MESSSGSYSTEEDETLPPLPEEFSEHFSTEHGVPFWVDEASGASTWSRPQAPPLCVDAFPRAAVLVKFRAAATRRRRALYGGTKTVVELDDHFLGLRVRPTAAGLIVSAIEPHSAAAKHNIRLGSVIARVGFFTNAAAGATALLAELKRAARPVRITMIAPTRAERPTVRMEGWLLRSRTGIDASGDGGGGPFRPHRFTRRWFVLSEADEGCLCSYRSPEHVQSGRARRRVDLARLERVDYCVRRGAFVSLRVRLDDSAAFTLGLLDGDGECDADESVREWAAALRRVSAAALGARAVAHENAATAAAAAALAAAAAASAATDAEASAREAASAGQDSHADDDFRAAAAVAGEWGARSASAAKARALRLSGVSVAVAKDASLNFRRRRRASVVHKERGKGERLTPWTTSFSFLEKVSGMRLQHSDGILHVVRVMPDSEAYTLGIAAPDKIVAVNDVHSRDADTLLAAIAAASRPVHICFEKSRRHRDGAPRSEAALTDFLEGIWDACVPPGEVATHCSTHDLLLALKAYVNPSVAIQRFLFDVSVEELQQEVLQRDEFVAGMMHSGAGDEVANWILRALEECDAKTDAEASGKTWVRWDQ